MEFIKGQLGVLEERGLIIRPDGGGVSSGVNFSLSLFKDLHGLLIGLASYGSSVHETKGGPNLFFFLFFLGKFYLLIFFFFLG